MIKNEQQYNITKEWLQKFEQSVAGIDNDENLKADPLRWQLYRDAYSSQVDEFKAEIAEYERLANCDKTLPIKIQIENFNKLPDVLIKARIAAKMAQKELADILGISEERIKECEDKDYQCATFLEILDISEALGVQFKNASVQVDFEEIEEFQKVADKWHKKQQAKQNSKTTTLLNESPIQ
ncbi:MAG: helix-turn-helix domain-containing protein [Cyanomargarita calcarea GSE-NOS-MK-12-04C]|jgi:DNA-binding XRE family transcriptional regulator|uniref:Helix-turn-helix domain-containing protein n=1 Tax=Cyanomargarita calcarea GSE-NOS-MK-12-04C TaxID=2839659 RepID=A0A951QPA1_9CYAN|nr:helix-turn-helix domain-containing protein [Cyanomargarita calcarea GSE-NOS-MK-12-04C]